MKVYITWRGVTIVSVLVFSILALIPVMYCDGARIPVYFEPSDATIQSGQEFTVNVVVGTEVNQAYNVTSDEIAFEFNPAILQVASVTTGPYLASSGSLTLPMTPSIDNVNGAVTGAAESIVGANIAPLGIGVIWEITFKATGEGSSDINFTRIWLAEPPGMPDDLLPVVLTKGTFTVTGGSPTTKTQPHPTVPTMVTPTATPTPTVAVPPPVTAPTTKPPAETPTPTPEEPGFGAVFAIAGLLAVAYLVLRRKQE